MSHLPRRAALAAAVLSLPLLTACGGGMELPSGPEAGAQPAAATVDADEPDFFLACGLLTAEEAATVLAGPSAKGEQSGMLSTETGASDCTWNRADGSSTSLSLTVYGDPAAWDPQRATGTADPEPVSGLGQASFITRSTFQDTVGFRSGDHVVTLTTQFANGMDGELVEVARLVADRL